MSTDSGVRENPRAAAQRILAAWLASQAFPTRGLDSVERHRGFVMEVVLGAVRQYGALRWLLRRYLRREPSPSAMAALLAGAYELLYMEGAAAHAAVHESVEAAKGACRAAEVALVNAVLRRVTAQRDELRRALGTAPLHIQLSHPWVLWRRWVQHWGRHQALRLCGWNNRRPSLIIRPRPTRVSADQYRARLHEVGIAAEPHPFDPVRFLILPHGLRPTDLPGFAEGDFYVQDPATAVAVDLLRPKPGEHILDACAAPGGKTLLLAEALRGTGRLVAVDRSEERVARLRENLARAGHAEVDVRCGDITDPATLGDEAGPEFDAVLVDVPCSNTGVLRRKPDARWSFTEARLRQLTELQRRLLDRAAELVRPGGRLVYSTCSLEPEEDEELVLAWVRDHPSWRCGTARKLFPPDTQTDGMYAVVLHREAGAL